MVFFKEIGVGFFFFFSKMKKLNNLFIVYIRKSSIQIED